MIWLGEKRGYLTDWTTQRWVEYTGKRLNESDLTWLRGPIGNTSLIGKESVAEVAANENLLIDEQLQERGLMDSFKALDGPAFSSETVAKEVSEFYENTSAYEMNAWAHWCGFFKPFGVSLALLFSRRLQQLNVPLNGLDTSKGMSSDVIQLKDDTGAVKYVA